ncbi:MAG: SDR family NAD(P)-dependent oxidoreductase [Myxococcota bacterium]|nr:SDR family NAD(P)-dependent oxidoreductase [Myxococcota bacterium]
MILITGASSGIGEACALKFAAMGHDLFLCARRLERLKSLQTKIKDQHSSLSVQIAQVDVASAKSCADFFTQYSEKLRQVSVLINNAGLARGLTTFQDSTFAEWDEMIDTNIKGVLRFTHGILPYFLEKSSGHIINLGSVAGLYTYPKGHVYNASKFAVHAFTESLRLDLVGSGIRVSEVLPGMVETEFSEVRLKDEAKARAVYQGMTPLYAGNIAESVAFIASQPPHVNIQGLVIYPTDQASPRDVHREQSLIP